MSFYPITTSVRQAVDNSVERIKDGVTEQLNTVKQGVITKVTDLAKFVVGMNNLSNAYTSATQTRGYKIIKHSADQFSIQPYEPSIIQRVRNTTGELTIGAAKVVFLSMLSHGGICKAAVGLGLMNPCSPLSVSGVTQGVFTGTKWAVSTTGTLLKLGSEYVALPTLKATAKIVLNNPVNSVVVLGAGGIAGKMLHSAAQDVLAMNKRQTFSIQGDEILINTNYKTFWEKAGLGFKATVKVAAAVGVVGAAACSCL